MRTPVSYVVVPKMEYVILRVDGHPANKRELVSAVKNGRVSCDKVRSPGKKMLWSKARVVREFVGE